MKIGDSLKEVVHAKTDKDWLIRLLLFILIVLSMSLLVQLVTLYVVR